MHFLPDISQQQAMKGQDWWTVCISRMKFSINQNKNLLRQSENRNQSVIEVGDRDAVLHKKICHILLCNNRKKNPLSHAYLMSKSFSLKFYNSFTSRCESGLGREASLGFVEKLCKSVHAYCIHSAYCILHTQCILHIIHRVHRCTL